MLLLRGADTGAKNYEDQTPVTMADDKDLKEVLKELKKGVKKKVKPFHINLEEEVRGVVLIVLIMLIMLILMMQGVFMCEDVNCPWPFNDKNIQEFVVSLKSNK